MSARAPAALASLLLLLLLACSPIEISPSPLAGTVGGVPWALGTAESDPFLSMGEPELWVDMWAETVAPCTDAIVVPRTNYLILSVPNAVGDYDFGEGLTATFVLIRPDGGRTNLVTDLGRIVVEQRTDTLVRGGVTVEYDRANRVSGRFDVHVCP